MESVVAPSQFLVTVPLRGLSGFRQRSTRRWRYFTPSGVRLLTPVMEPEKLHQWLEVEQFQKSTPHWHESDVNIQGDLLPARVVSVFQALLHRAISSCNLSGKRPNLSHLLALLASKYSVEILYKERSELMVLTACQKKVGAPDHLVGESQNHFYI
ncbi:Hypothetical predicted protein [Pelobates cultripes]|uniref:Mab-21-like nucleotidyltransferase domain-containing protein n=1 Tax=Pelobates cultripes TaxID=61616 RepID=A0AAD1QWA9_PELCU|nr:Hypothetical predicted protein [Pelobates cultripes]